MKNLPGGLLNLKKNSFLEENIVNYIVRNITQPIDIVIENQVIEEEHGQYNTSFSNNASGEGYHDCMTQCSRKTQDENAEAVEESALEKGENPLATFHSPLLETAVTTETPTISELVESFVIAPGEGKKPVSILNDVYCEEMAHPRLFPTGRFGYKVKRKVPLTPSKYFNQRLLNYSQKFASDSDYIFFAHAI